MNQVAVLNGHQENDMSLKNKPNQTKSKNPENDDTSQNEPVSTS